MQEEAHMMTELAAKRRRSLLSLPLSPACPPLYARLPGLVSGACLMKSTRRQRVHTACDRAERGSKSRSSPALRVNKLHGPRCYRQHGQGGARLPKAASDARAGKLTLFAQINRQDGPNKRTTTTMRSCLCFAVIVSQTDTGLCFGVKWGGWSALLVSKTRAPHVSDPLQQHGITTLPRALLVLVLRLRRQGPTRPSERRHTDACLCCLQMAGAGRRAAWPRFTTRAGVLGRQCLHSGWLAGGLVGWAARFGSARREADGARRVLVPSIPSACPRASYARRCRGHQPSRYHRASPPSLYLLRGVPRRSEAGWPCMSLLHTRKLACLDW